MARGMGLAAEMVVLVVVLAAARCAAEDSQPVPAECLQKVLPCRAYLNSTTKPPESCCGPLKEALATDMQCLCQIFYKDQIFKSLNVSQAQALQLPKSCGSKADLSLCKNGSSTSPPSSNTPASPSGNNQKSSSTSMASLRLMDVYGLTALSIVLLSWFGGSPPRAS